MEKLKMTKSQHLYQSDNLTCYLLGPKKEAPRQSHTAIVKLCSTTFGLANRRIWEFVVNYNTASNFNCELPPVAAYRATPRSAWHEQRFEPDADPYFPSTEEQLVIDNMPTGYTYAMFQRYHSKLATLIWPKPFYKLAWDATCRPIDADAAYYIHPEERRLLYKGELKALAGVAGDPLTTIPAPIVAYMQKQIDYYIADAWGKDNFAGFYDSVLGWRECEGSATTSKAFDFTLLEPQHIHYLSDPGREVNRG